MLIQYRRTPRQEVASRIFHVGNKFSHRGGGMKMKDAWEIAGESIWVTK